SLRGKVVVLNFWQSYCAPCTREARTLADTAERWKDRGVVFLGVDEQDLRGPALKFMRRFDIRYPIVADDLSLTGHYGVTGYPETFFIDRRGRVIPPHIVGPATRETLEQALAAPALASEQHPTQGEIEAELVCPQCHTPLDESDSPIAQQMKAFIRAHIAMGWTKSRIEN